MNTLKNILKMINKINLAELLVCSEKKIQWQKMQNIKRQVSFIKWMSAYRLQQSHWNKYEKGNTFIKSFLFNMLLMKYSFIFLKTYYILLHLSKKIKMLYVMTTEVKISLLYSYKFTITVLECQSLNRLFIHVQPQLIFTRRRKVLTFRSFY